MKLPLIALIFILITPNSYSINDFTSDGCSVYPDGILGIDNNKWFHCCFYHDISYWIGGEKEERHQADSELKNCVAEVTTPEHAKLMEIGVLLGGSPLSVMPWRWGYGFNEIDLSNWKWGDRLPSVDKLPKIRLYENLTSKEKRNVKTKLDSILMNIKKRKEKLNHKQKSYMIKGYKNMKEKIFNKD